MVRNSCWASSFSNTAGVRSEAMLLFSASKSTGTLVQFGAERSAQHASRKSLSSRDQYQRFQNVKNTGDPAELVADSTLFQSDFGWSPKYSDLDTIISSAWNWHQNQWG